MNRPPVPSGRPLMLLLTCACALWATACDDEPSALPAAPDAGPELDGSDADPAADAETPAQWRGPVLELAFRSIVDEDAFDRLGPILAEAVQSGEGFVAARELRAFASFAPDPMPAAPIQIGVGQYASTDAWAAIGEAALADPEVAPALEAYRDAIEPVGGVSTVVVRPLDPDAPVDVADLVRPGQVLEIAVRDLDAIDDEAAFFAAKEAFVDRLTGADGVIREYEWISATEADRYYVGMTLYESMEAFAAVSSDPAITGGPEAMAFFAFPPLLAQFTVPVEAFVPRPMTEERASGATVISHRMPGGPRVHTYVSPVEVGANATHVVEGREAVVVFDSQWFADYARDFRAYVDSLGKPIERVIITHGHLDHYLGLSAAFRDVEVHALAETRAIIEGEGPYLFENFGPDFGYADVESLIVPSNVLAEGALSIDGVDYRIESVEGAESEQGILVEFTDRAVWLVGDLVYNDVHLFIEDRATIDPWIAALEDLADRAGGLILAGHGRPGGLETVAFNLEYLRTAREALTEADDGPAYRDAMVAAYPGLGGEFFFDIFLPMLFPVDTTDDVVEIAVRRLEPGQDVGAFAAARDAFVDRLRAQPGVGTDREFRAVIDFATFAAPEPPVYIGMTQYDSLDAFAAAGEALGMSPEARAFFQTFTPEAFTALRPLEPGAPVDLAAIAGRPGQVLEVAVRDLSTYPDFSPDDYATARDAFIELLGAQPGVIAEHQWTSALDADLVVGMTVYEDIDAFAAVSASPAITEAPETGAFLGGYPPLVGYVSAVVR